jgi:hypothetical protein
VAQKLSKLTEGLRQHDLEAFTRLGDMKLQSLREQFGIQANNAHRYFGIQANNDQSSSASCCM